MHTRTLATLVSLLALGASPMEGQIPKSALIAVVETHKASLLRYIDAAPDSMLDFRPTKGVRSYAEQIEHAAIADAYIAHLAIAGNGKIPALGDSAVYRHNKAALRKMTIDAMDHTIAMLRGVSDAAFTQEIQFAGKTMPRYRALMELQDHFPWTLGQVVPYLRMHGVKPPEYTPF